MPTDMKYEAANELKRKASVRRQGHHLLPDASYRTADQDGPAPVARPVMGDVRMLERDLGGAPAQDGYQTLGPDDLRRVAALRRAGVMGAAGSTRVARAAAWQAITDPNASPVDRAAAIAQRDMAEFDENNERRGMIDANRAAGLSPGGNPYLSPQKVIANRAELNRQLRANTGADGGRISQGYTPPPDPVAFFLGNGADRYRGATKVATDLAGANRLRTDLNAEQNATRGPIDFGEYIRPDAGVVTPSIQADAESLRRAAKLRTALESSRGQIMESESNRALAESRAGESEAQSRRAYSDATAGLAPELAQTNADIQRLSVQSALRDARAKNAPVSGLIGNPGEFASMAAEYAKTLASGADSMFGTDFNTRARDFDINVLQPLEALARSNPVEARQIASTILPLLNDGGFTGADYMRINPLLPGMAVPNAMLIASRRSRQQSYGPLRERLTALANTTIPSN